MVYVALGGTVKVGEAAAAVRCLPATAPPVPGGPLAAAVKVADWPSVTDWLVGLLVMVGEVPWMSTTLLLLYWIVKFCPPAVMVAPVGRPVNVPVMAPVLVMMVSAAPGLMLPARL